MTLTEVKGLVIRTVDIKEADRLITIFSEEMGVVTALAMSARSYKSKKMSSTMLYCYSTFVLYKRGEHYYVKEASLIESFFGIRNSIDGLALAAYIAEVLNDVTTAEAEKDLLRLSLNSLYAISENKYELRKIKAAFEIRAAAIIGFMPEVVSCSRCGEKYGSFYFEIMRGTICCYNCNEKKSNGKTEDISETRQVVSLLSEGAKFALTYCIYSPLEKIFSFNISNEDMDIFSKATEEYLLNQLERSFKSLEFYKEVKR